MALCMALVFGAMACVGTVYGVQALGVRMVIVCAYALGVRVFGVRCVYRSMTW